MIPNQDQVDMSKPEEHFLWALRNMPTMAGSGMITNPSILKGWSRHLVEAGFVHTSAVAALADKNGMIHVSKLPKQQIKFQAAFRGPRDSYNNAARWVKQGTPDPKPTRLQDISKLTIEEQYAMAKQVVDLGLIRVNPQGRDTAQVIN